MNIDKAVMNFAGTVVLTGLVLSQIFSPYWLLLSAFAGINLLQAPHTGFCPIVSIMKKLGLKPGNAFE